MHTAKGFPVRLLISSLSAIMYASMMSRVTSLKRTQSGRLSDNHAVNLLSPASMFCIVEALSARR